MANEEHLAILKQGVWGWNEWIEGRDSVLVDLSGADLSNMDLGEADLCVSDLSEADLSNSYLYRADLRQANLSRANLGGANLDQADLRGAILTNANLRGAFLRDANFSEADLSGANLSGANLSLARLVNTRLTGVDLTGSRVFGAAVWNVDLAGSTQDNLVITRPTEPIITVDNLEVAQFIYLLLNNEKVRNIINTITTKVVLILGRFTPERKAVLDTLRDTLREHNYLPVLFDFDKPATRDVTETVSTLAHLARFIIADITDPRSIPQELSFIVPDLPSVPVVPLLHRSGSEWGMFKTFKRYHWVLPVLPYDDLDDLLSSLDEKVIGPAEAKAKEQAKTMTA